VTLTAQIEDSCVDSFKNHMVELTHGDIEFIMLEHRENTILPFKIISVES
jgi:hypothetical protein